MNLSVDYGISYDNSQSVLEIFGVWVVDRSRITSDGIAPDYINRYIPFYLLEQLARTIHRSESEKWWNKFIFGTSTYGVCIQKRTYRRWTDITLYIPPGSRGWLTTKDSQMEKYERKEIPFTIKKEEILGHYDYYYLLEFRFLYFKLYKRSPVGGYAVERPAYEIE